MSRNRLRESDAEDAMIFRVNSIEQLYSAAALQHCKALQHLLLYSSVSYSAAAYSAEAYSDQ